MAEEMHELLTRVEGRLSSLETTTLAFQKTQEKLLDAMNQLVRIDAENKNTEKSLSVLWDLFRKAQDKNTTMWWKLIAVSLGSGGIGSVGAESILKVLGS